MDMDPVDYDQLAMDRPLAVAEKHEAELQDETCDSAALVTITHAEHEKMAASLEGNDLDNEEDLSKRGKLKMARDNLKKINVIVKSKIDVLGRVSVFGGRKKAVKQKRQKQSSDSGGIQEVETQPPLIHSGAESQHDTEAAAVSHKTFTADGSAESGQDMHCTTSLSTDGVDFSTTDHSALGIGSTNNSENVMSSYDPSALLLDLPIHVPPQSTKITHVNVNSDITVVNDLLCADTSTLLQELETTSIQPQPTTNNAINSVGSLQTHSMNATSNVISRGWADSIKSTTSRSSASVNRGCLEGTGPAVPVDFLNPVSSLDKNEGNVSEYDRFYFRSVDAVLTSGQTDPPDNGYNNNDNYNTDLANDLEEVNPEQSDGEKMSESDYDFWGSEFEDSSSQDEVLCDGRGYDVDDTPNKPLPSKSGKKRFFRKSRFTSCDSPPPDESSNCLPVNINLEKHPQPKLPPQPSGLTQNQIKRRLVVESIIGSERSYLESLERLIKDYEKTLLEFISQPKSHIRLVFSKMREIIYHHKMFQIELTECVKLWDEEEKIGDIFTASFSKTMLINAYSIYVNNFAVAMDEIRLLQRSRQTFQEFLQKQEKASCDRLTIFALMVKPVQRFPQFIMFLQDLIKLTPQDHDDRRALQLALTELENVAYRLNERKRQSEQKFQAHQTVKMLIKQKVQHVLDTWNLDDDHKRRLIRTDRIEQIIQHGESESLKSKDRRLILMNDHVLCVKVIQKEHMGYTVERYALRWVAKLRDLELHDTALTSDVHSLLGRESGRFQISQQLDDSDDDPFHLLADLREMAHDHAIIQQMSDLVTRLKRSYVGHGLREELIHEISNDLKQMIQVKGEQLRLVNSSTIILKDMSRLDKPHCVLQVPSTAFKQDWCIDFLMAKLALDKTNSLAWDGTSGSDGGDFDVIPAYFMKHVPVDVPKNYTSIKCAVSVYLNLKKSTTGVGLQHLWVCSSTPGHGQVSVLSVQNSKPTLVEAFKACSCDILAVELVPGCGHMTQPTKLLFAEDTVWMVASQNEILVFPLASQDGVHRHPLAMVPVLHTIVSVKFVDEQLFCGSTAGILTIYLREPDGSWNISNPTALSVGSAVVRIHFVYQEYMWLSSGNRLCQLDIDSLQMQTVSVLHVNDESHIEHVVKSGIGIWVSFCGNSVIKLFHLETMENLQEISVGNFVSRILTEKSWTITGALENLAVTALAVSRGFLWIGTSLGVILTVPLPRLSDGVPLYRGSPKLSLHAHKGPVRFLHLLPSSSGVVEMNNASSLSSVIAARQSSRNLERKRLNLEAAQKKMTNTESGNGTAKSCSNLVMVSESEDSARFSSSMNEKVIQEERVELSGKLDGGKWNSLVPSGETMDNKESRMSFYDDSVQLRNKRRSPSTDRRSKTMSSSVDLVNRNLLRSKTYSQSILDLNSAEPCEVKILYRSLLADSSGDQEQEYVGEIHRGHVQTQMGQKLSARTSSQTPSSQVSTPSWLMNSASHLTHHSGNQHTTKIESHKELSASANAQFPETSTIDRKHVSKAGSNAVIVVSGGDGYTDLDTTRRDPKMEDACVLLWIHKFY